MIVGVGNADFEAMEQLDADKEPMISTISGKIQQRDIVQFVEFQKYRNDPELLSKQVLAEIPKQMVQYF